MIDSKCTCIGEELASPLEMVLDDEETAAASDVFRKEVTAVALWSVAIAAIVNSTNCTFL